MEYFNQSILIFLLGFGAIWAQDVSPCPKLFVYEANNSEPDRRYGIVTLLSEMDLSGIWLRLVFDRPSIQLGNWFGEVSTTDNKEYLIKNRNFQLKANTPQTVRFYLSYDTSQPAPKLLSFRLNAKTVCPEGSVNDVTTIKPELLTSGPLPTTTSKPFLDPVPPIPSISEEEEFFPGDFSFINTPSKNLSNTDNIDSICGTVVVKEQTKRQAYNYYHYSYPHHHNHNHSQNNQLDPHIRDIIQILLKPTHNNVEFNSSLQAHFKPSVAHGEPTYEGEYPWQAVLYHARGIDLVYICGASLISKYHVLTVAHCVTKKRSQIPLNPTYLVVYLGKYYLRRFSSPAVQDRQVSEIFPHPQYDAMNYRNDIALVKFSTPVEITDFVRPVCLWQESSDLNSVLNKEGSVIGWGFDEIGKVTEKLMRVKMPVVSQQTCLYSYPDFYSRFTSSNTYCAGFQNGTSVCNGDSGGGMVFPRVDNEKIWQLRGLVSISVAMQNQFRCDASHYVVFTDTAKYLDWIKMTMSK